MLTGGLTGIDAVVFGVTDMAAARQFLRDWGTEEQEARDDLLRFSTVDGAQIIVRPLDDPGLPAAMESGPTLRQVIWGVANDAALERVAAAAGTARDSNLTSITDPNGLSHAFRVSRRKPVTAAPQLVNGPGAWQRIDQRAPSYERAHPLGIGHIVLFVDDLAVSLEFFVGKLGFAVSDSYPGHAAFLRCHTPGPHHHAFILQRPGNPGLNHVAFTVNTINEVFGGGIAMSAKGWETELGPGRHPISSAYFWYFKSPFGAALEYYADDDYCTEAWQPGEFARSPNNFAEWAIVGGIDGATRRQVRAASEPHS